MMIDIIVVLQNLSSESIIGLEYIICCIAIIGMVSFFGQAGLFSYIALAAVIGNIQILKTIDFSFLNFHVAHGTIVFSSIFIVIDILNEFYGPSKARRAVWVGFCAILFTTMLMVLTIGIKPVSSNLEVQTALEKIFMPQTSLFSASLISYLICQNIDIWIFQLIRRITLGKYLWLRTMVSTIISSLLDNIIFSTLAFMVFAGKPATMQELVYTYILGTYIFRVIMILLQTPIIYFIRVLLK